MAWEKRRNGRYFYRRRKVAGHCIREYVCPGLAGVLAETEDARRRTERLAERDARRRERAERGAVEGAVRDVCTQVETLMRAVLYDQGFHLHGGHSWRKRRRT